MIQGAFRINIGDKLVLKKKHPCGSFEWEVIRVGADIKIKCCVCNHIVMQDRAELRKKVKKIIAGEDEK